MSAKTISQVFLAIAGFSFSAAIISAVFGYWLLCCIDVANGIYGAYCAKIAAKELSNDS